MCPLQEASGSGASLNPLYELPSSEVSRHRAGDSSSLLSTLRAANFTPTAAPF